MGIYMCTYLPLHTALSGGVVLELVFLFVFTAKQWRRETISHCWYSVGNANVALKILEYPWGTLQ